MIKQYDVVTSEDYRNLILEVGLWLDNHHNNFTEVKINTNCKDGLYIASIEYHKNGCEIDE